jgi:hypothetical protein
MDKTVVSAGEKSSMRRDWTQGSILKNLVSLS